MSGPDVSTSPPVTAGWKVRTRVATGLGLAVIALACMAYRHPVPPLILTGLTFALGFWELVWLYRPVSAWLMAAACSAVLALFVVLGLVASPALGLGLTLLAVLLLIRPGAGEQKSVSALAACVWLTSGMTSVYVLALRGAPAIGDFGWNLALVALPSLWAGDSLAYFVGKAYGKHPLAPQISPKKTWEGAAGHIVGALAFSLTLGHFAGLPVATNLVLGIVASIAGQSGDLLQSWMKRGAQIKDTGNILPGHGGVLDRIDAMLLAGPVLLLLLAALAPQFVADSWLIGRP
jgi:phosphatidate cytidylyltransferase